MKWINVEDKLPKESETVWAINKDTRFIMLGCIVYEDGWLWAESKGIIYCEDNNIVAECELDDEYDITHWQPLPKLPKP